MKSSKKNSKIRHFTQSILTVSIASALYVGGVSAADKPVIEDEIEVIEVTGMLSSIKEATRIKRSSSGFVDAIVAEDIGKFPDTNLAESLQRISGVTIDRSGGEGSKITVRGMGPNFNLVTLNGRQMPNAGGGRSFRFADIAAEMVSGVEVHKSTSASVQSGGIGSTINIKMAEPLSLGDRVATTAKIIDDSSGGGITPSISGLVSTVINDDFGILVAGSFQEREYSFDKLKIPKWRTDSRPIGGLPDEHHFYPQQSIYGSTDVESKRVNGSLVLQYAIQDNLVLTFDHQYSNFEEDKHEIEGAIWFGAPQTATSAMVDENNTTTLLGFEDRGIDFFNRLQTQVIENNSTGLKLDWDVTDNSNIILAYSDSSSKQNPDGNFSMASDIQAWHLDYDFVIDGDYSYPILDQAGVKEENLVLWQGNQSVEQYTDDFKQLRLDYVFDDGDGVILKAGFMHTDQTKVKQRWQSDDKRSFRKTALTTPYDEFNSDGTVKKHYDALYPNGGADGYEIITINNEFAGDVTLLKFAPVASYEEWLQFMGKTPKLVLRDDWYDINEATTSVYIELINELTLAGKPITIVTGARYEQTDITSISEEANLTGFVIEDNSDVDTRMTKVLGEPIAYSSTGNYKILLPNMSIKYDMTDDVVLRFAASRSITRPTLGNMRSSRSFGDLRPGGIGAATGGNANLKPFISDNIDFAVEWYINDFDYISAAIFSKTVDNFIASRVSELSLEGVIDPFTGKNATYEITQPENLDVADIEGLELSGQYAFGESGFGVTANMTFVSSDAEYDPNGLDGTLALEGVGDSANVVAYYEKDNLQARIAYNWRDGFFQNFSNVTEPRMVDSYGQLDISASYNLTENMTVFAEGINITNEDTRTHSRYSNQMLEAISGSARYALGIRVSF